MSGENTTWRERIVEARDRKVRVGFAFTEKDRADIANPHACMVWEAAVSIGMTYPQLALVVVSEECRAMTAVRNDNPDAAERSLYAIEDRALQLKREAGSAHAPASPRRAARP